MTSCSSENENATNEKIKNFKKFKKNIDKKYCSGKIVRHCFPASGAMLEHFLDCIGKYIKWTYAIGPEADFV